MNFDQIQRTSQKNKTMTGNIAVLLIAWFRQRKWLFVFITGWHGWTL